MKKSGAFAVLAGIAAMSSAPTAAQTQSQEQSVQSSGGFLLGRMLYTACISENSSERVGCQSYLMGIADAMAMHKDNRWAPPVLCNTQTLRKEDLGAIYIDFIRRNPQRSEWTAASTAYTALAERYPCQPAQQ